MRVDVCVIGTGAGGAPVAKELAEGGMRVAMLEEGDLFTTDEFTARPRDMTARLYRDAGQIATAGNVPIVMPLGSGVGGTTLVNSGTCFRTPAACSRCGASASGSRASAPTSSTRTSGASSARSTSCRFRRRSRAATPRS